MKADSGLEQIRKDNHEGLAVIDEILAEIRSLNLKMDYGGFNFDD